MTDETNTQEIEDQEPVETEQQDETGATGEEAGEGEVVETDGAEKPVEPWMETEEEETDEPKTETVSLKTLLKAKGKFKEKNSELSAKLEEVQAELERLKSSSPAKAKASEPRPKEWDFETDEAYQAALDEWEDKRIAAKLETMAERKARLEAEERQKSDISSSMDQHFERADKLIKESGISPEVYAAADTTLRESVDKIMPGRGSAVIDILYSRVKEGSEKVGFYLGRNEAARNQFLKLLAEDPSGLSAGIFLGEQKARLSGAAIKNKTSKAPAPAPNADGGMVAVDSAAALKKQYDTEKSMQKQLDIRRQARKAGVDVSKW